MTDTTATCCTDCAALIATMRGVPEHLHEGLAAYVIHRRETGGFLTAVMENDLMGTMSRADFISRDHLPGICGWVYNEPPAPCHGSREAVEKWLGGK